jgi:TolB protein
MKCSPRFPALVAALACLTICSLAFGQEKAAPAAATPEQDNVIYVCKPDGSDMKPFVDLPDYRAQGSPTWSQDGKLVAFDAWRPKLGERNSDSKVVVCKADGSNPRILGDGAMPSFSPRHNRIAFSRYSPNYGVWVMSSEGPDKELALLDETGWSAEWSPDGKQIVYAASTGNAANLMVFDLVEGIKIPLFDEGQSPYSSFFWNFSWSPDGKWIVFRGQRTDGGKFEVGLVDARGAKQGLVTRLEGDTSANYAWTPDSKQFLIGQRTADRGNRLQLYLLAAATKDPPELLAGQDPERANASGAFSPDGKQLLIVSRKPPPAAAKAKAKAK